MAIGPPASGIVPGQDLSINLQALLVWLGNYGHISYEKQQELLREIGGIEIGIGTLQATNARVADAVLPQLKTYGNGHRYNLTSLSMKPRGVSRASKNGCGQPQVKIFACFMLPTLAVAQN
jgi:hypothetical protein